MPLLEVRTCRTRHLWSMRAVRLVSVVDEVDGAEGVLLRVALIARGHRWNLLEYEHLALVHRFVSSGRKGESHATGAATGRHRPQRFFPSAFGLDSAWVADVHKCSNQRNRQMAQGDRSALALNFCYFS